MDSTNQELRKSVIPGNEATNRAASDSLHAALQLHIGQSVRWKFKLASIRADGAPVLAPLERTSDRTPEVIDRAVLTVADASKQDFVANASAETRIWLKTARPGEECLIVGEMSDLSAQSQFYVEGGKQNHKTTFAAQIQRATISKP